MTLGVCQCHSSIATFFNTDRCVVWSLCHSRTSSSIWQSSTIVDLQNLVSNTNLVCRVQMHYRAKFGQNWSNGCGDMAVFQHGGWCHHWIKNLRYFNKIIFTVRHYAKRGIYRVCVSVCVFVCIKTAKRRITQIMLHDSPDTLVFWRQR